MSTWKECEFENCHKKAKYALVYKKPDRCEYHKENRKLEANVPLDFANYLAAKFAQR